MGSKKQDREDQTRADSARSCPANVVAFVMGWWSIRIAGLCPDRVG